MESTTKVDELAVRFVSIETVGFYLAQINKDLAKSEDFLNSLAIKFSGQNYILPDENNLIFAFMVEFVFVDFNDTNQKETPVLRHNSESVFHIANLESHFKLDSNGSYTSDKRIAIHLAGVALSTARGILVEKTANTPLKHILLPIFAPDFLEGVDKPYKVFNK